MNKKFLRTIMWELGVIYLIPLLIYGLAVIFMKLKINMNQIWMILISAMVYSASYVLVYSLCGTRWFWLTAIVFSLPCINHIFIKFLGVFTLYMIVSKLTGGMTSLNIQIYKDEYDQRNRGSYMTPDEYAKNRSEYANRSLKQAQKTYDKHLQTIQNLPSPVRLAMTPVIDWRC